MPGDAEKPWGDKFPTNYFRDCVGRPRPCPWFRCKYHLLLDVSPETGTITLNVGRVTKLSGYDGRKVGAVRRHNTISSRGFKGERELFEAGEKKLFLQLQKSLEDDSPTCVLDCVESGRTYTLEEIGDIFNITRERVRQIESKAERKLRRAAETKEHEEWKAMTEA